MIKKLKIGGHTYKIELTDDKNLLEKDTAGMLCREKGTIYILKSLMESEKEATLIHEILHAINGELDEVTVEGIAQQLYQIVKENNVLYRKMR